MNSIDRSEVFSKKGYLPQAVAARALRMSASGLTNCRKSSDINIITFGREIYVRWADVRETYADAADIMELSHDAEEVIAAFATQRAERAERKPHEPRAPGAARKAPKSSSGAKRKASKSSSGAKPRSGAASAKKGKSALPIEDNVAAVELS